MEDQKIKVFRINQSDKGKQEKLPSKSSKKTIIILFLLIPISFFAGFYTSKLVEVEIPFLLKKMDQEKSTIFFDLTINRTESDIIVILSNIQHNFNISDSAYSINSNNYKSFLLDQNQTKKELCISHSEYIYFDLGANNTNLITVKISNIKNYTLIKDSSFNF